MLNDGSGWDDYIGFGRFGCCGCWLFAPFAVFGERLARKDDGLGCAGVGFGSLVVGGSVVYTVERCLWVRSREGCGVRAGRGRHDRLGCHGLAITVARLLRSPRSLPLRSPRLLKFSWARRWPRLKAGATGTRSDSRWRSVPRRRRCQKNLRRERLQLGAECRPSSRCLWRLVALARATATPAATATTPAAAAIGSRGAFAKFGSVVADRRECFLVGESASENSRSTER